MLKKAIRRLFINMAVFSLFVGMLSPLASVTGQADPGYGTIAVRTNHNDGSYSIYQIDPDPLNPEHYTLIDTGSGAGYTYFILPATYYPGVGYKIVFHDTVDGFDPPEDYHFALTIGSYLYYTGEYTSPMGSYETVSLNSNINEGSYVIYRDADDVPVDFGPLIPGEGTTVSHHILPSLDGFPGIGYRVHFNDADGYITPDDIPFGLITGEPEIFTGLYTPDGSVINYESVTVNSNINEGSYTIYRTSDNAVMDFGPAIPGNGTQDTIHLLPSVPFPGVGYEIVFNSVDDYITPDNIVFSLIDGIPHDYTGEYMPDEGGITYESVTVNTNIAYGSYSIYRTGDDAFMGAGPAVPGQGTVGTIFLLPSIPFPGVGYEIVFDDVPNYTTPPNKVFSLIEGEPFQWTGYYNQTPIAAYLSVEVVDESDNPITDGDWALMICGSEEPSSCTATFANGGPGIDQVPASIYGPTYFRVFAYDSPGYGTPIIVSENPQILEPNQHDIFRIMYPDEGAQLAISATTDGIPAEVDFMYCTGDADTNDCSAVYTTVTTTPVLINVADSGDQFLAFEELDGYMVPENQASSPPEAAQAVEITGHDGFYYYPIESDEITEGAVIMNYATDDSATLNVTVEGPPELVEADVTVDQIGLGEVGSATIANGDTEAFDVTYGEDYLVNCGAVAGFEPIEDTIVVPSTEFNPVSHEASATCEYVAIEDVAYLNITTNPVPASVTMNVLSSTPDGQTTPQTGVTTVPTGVPSTYELDRVDPNDDRFTLIGDGVTPYVQAQLQVTCNPAPGGVIAPAPFTMDPANYPVDMETYLDPCIYTLAEDEEKITIEIDTINVTDSAIFVDGVEVRPELNDDVASVEISVAETHMISFADRTGFVTPDDIEIPANTYSGDETFTPLYLGYYVEYNEPPENFETDVAVTTRTVGGTVYLEVGSDPTHWVVGHVENPGDTLLVQVDRRVDHEFHFQDKNNDEPPYVLRAEPEALGACTVEHEAGDPTTEISGTDLIVTHFQQHYVCPADETDMLPDGVSLTGHYIETAGGSGDGDAAFFRARTTNSDVSGEIYAMLGVDDDTYTYNPGPADPTPDNWTDIFVSDVVNDTNDTASFESPVTYMSEDYSALPDEYQLSSFSPGEVLNDLTSTYYNVKTDVTVRLISLDETLPNQPEEGMEVYMDQGQAGERLEYTVDNAGSIEATFETVTTNTDHAITCPYIDGFQQPHDISLPAGSMDPLTPSYTFDCLYAPSATAAEIQIETYADDVTNLTAPIVMEVDGIDYNVGFTYEADTATRAHMELWIDTAVTNIIEYGEVLPYITPDPDTVSVLPGTSYQTSPENIFDGHYTLPEEATINVYTMDEVTDAADGIDDTVITLTNLVTSASQTIADVGDTGNAIDIPVEPNTDYRIDFGDHPTDAYDDTSNPNGYIPPAPIFFNIGDGDESHYLGVYVRNPNACEVELYRQRTGTLEYLDTEVMLRVNGGTQFSIGTGDPANDHLVTYVIDQTVTEGIYEFDFMPLPPPDDTLPITPPSLDLPEASMTCPYQRTIMYGFGDDDTVNFNITLYEMDADDGAVPDADVTLNGTDTQQSDSGGLVTFVDVPVNTETTFSFGEHPTRSDIFSAPLDLVYPANTLTPDETYNVDVYYILTAEAVELAVSTVDETNQTFNVNGEINLIIDGSSPFLYGIGTADILVSNNPVHSYQIDWGPAMETGYMEPLDDPHDIDNDDFTSGTVIGLYRPSSGPTSIVNITTYSDSVDPLNIINAEISVNGIPVGNGQHTGTYAVGDVIDITFESLMAYGTPYVYEAGNPQGQSYTHTLTVNTDENDNVIDAVYIPLPDTVAFTIDAEDHEGTSLPGEGWSTSGSLSGVTPDNFAVLTGDLDDYTISFADKDGYVAPEDLVITNQVIDTVPEGITITVDGIPYVPGTTLDVVATGAIYDIMGTYEPRVTIEKEVADIETIINNNVRVDYRITIERNDRDQAGDLDINVHDSISDTGGVLTGSNGGTLTIVTQNGDNTVCYTPPDFSTPLPTCPDIVSADQVVTISNPGTSLAIQYQLLSDNSGIPTGQTSAFTNTVLGSYDDGGETFEDTNDTDVTVSGPSAGPGPGPGPSGGGGSYTGGGGGHIMIKGDMVLEVEKLISLDGTNYKDASEMANALVMPENKNTRVYSKVRLTNLGKVSAVDIRFKQNFDEGESDMTADGIEDLSGATLDSKTGEIKIAKIPVGGTAEFTYNLMVHEMGQNDQFAKEFLELVDFESKLPKSQDQLSYLGIGDEYPSYLVAGALPSYVTESDFLRITVQSDKDAARIGEIVNFLITAENLTGSDMTGLILTHDYDESALEVLKAFGGRDDGREVHFTRAILRPGEKASYQVQARVGGGAPVGGTIRGVTRALVNEHEGVSQVENFLSIIGGVAPVQPVMQLAQTGPAQLLILLMLAALAYFGHKEFTRRRYLTLKRAALRPL